MERDSRGGLAAILGYSTIQGDFDNSLKLRPPIDEAAALYAFFEAGISLSGAPSKTSAAAVRASVAGLEKALGQGLYLKIGAQEFGSLSPDRSAGVGSDALVAHSDVPFGSVKVETAFRRFAEACRDRLRTPHGPIQATADLIATQDLLHRAERRVQHRAALMQALFDLSPIGIILLDRDSGNILNANNAFLAFGHWKADEVVGKSIDSMLQDSKADLRNRAVNELDRTGRFGPQQDAFLRPDGSEFPAILRGISWPGPEGRRWVWLLIEDITAQQQALAEAKAHSETAIKARAELDAALEALPHGFVLFDAEDKVAMCNDYLRKIFPGMEDLFQVGMRYDDILTEGIRRGIFPEAIGREADFIAEVKKNRKQRRLDRLTELQNGRVVRVIEVAIPSGGRVGLRIDVTEEELARRRLSDVIEGSQAGTWEVDLITGKNIVNERWATMLGWRREDLEPITTEIWRSLIHPHDVEEVSNSVKKMLSGETYQYEHIYRMRHADGHWVWINDRGRISGWGPDGKPTRMAGVHVDFSALKETEQRLEDIINGAEVGTWQFNVKTGRSIINARWAEMLGYTADELGDLTYDVWVKLIHPDDLVVMMADQKAAFGHEKWHFSYENRLRHKAGHWVWVSSRGRVTAWDEDGAPLIMSGVHIDISAKKNLEMVIEDDRDFLAQLMQTSDSGIMAVNAEGRVVFCNAEVARQLELPIDVIQGNVCDPQILGVLGEAGQTITMADMPCQICMRNESGYVRDMRLRLMMKDGRQKVLSVNGSRTNEATKDVRAVLTITDVTDAALAEERLREARSKAEAANRAKSQFLATMSHELRTPLNGVLGMVELLSGEESKEERRDMVATIRESAAHLLAIVNDILDLAKVESGNLELSKSPVDLADLCRRVTDVHAVQAGKKKIALNLTIDPVLSKPRLGDRQRIMQILHNCLSNAVKFTERGGVTLHVSALKDDLVRFRISDTGIGMTLEETGRVFEEFTQADAGINRKFGGTGLGLSIVKRLVGLMQGTVNLESVKGRGTTLTIEVKLPPAVDDQKRNVAGSGAGLGGIRALRALVAEDNATNQIILRAMLARLGLSAIFANDGNEVIEKWKPGAFDVLLMDISMPVKDGITALEELRVLAADTKLPPAIAVTANAMTHHVESYREAGFAAVVAKPIKLDDLARAIAEAVLAETS